MSSKAGLLVLLFSLHILYSCGSDLKEESRTLSVSSHQPNPAIFGVRSGGTQFIRKGNYIYYRTPYAAMADGTKKIVIAQSLEVLKKKLNQLIPENEFTEKILKKAKDSANNIDELIELVFDQMLKFQEEGFRVTDLLPTAILGYVGGVFSGNFKIGGGGSVSIGLVIQPFLVKRLCMVSKKTIEYIEYQTAWIGWPNINVGGGMGGGGRARGGLGVIWGQLDSPEEFVGPALGVSKSIVAGPGGVNFRGGALHQWGSKQLFQNPFFAVGYEAGGAATMELHGSLSYVLHGSSLLKMLGIDIENSTDPTYMDLQGNTLDNKTVSPD